MATTRMVGRVSVRVMPDTRRFRADLVKDLEKLERSLSVAIPTRIDTKKVARDAARVKADVERQLGRVRVGVDVNTGQAARDLARATRDRTASIRPEVDGTALARTRAALDSLARSTTRAVGGTAGIGAIAGSFAALAAGAAAAVVPVLQLGSALAPAVGILATLPAAAGTAAAAVAPLAVALSGVGEALGAAISGDADKLADSLEGLAPAARQVVEGVAELQPGLARLREQVQEGFFRPLVEPARELGQRLLPVLGSGMTLVSMALGESAAGMARFLGESRNLEGLQLLWSSTAQSIENARGTIPGLTAGFRELGLVGLPYIEQAATGMQTLSARFATWAREAAESGRAVEWIENAIDVFSDLGDIAGNVGGIIGSVFRGAGDGGLLGTLEEVTGAFDEFLSSAEGTQALEGIFSGLGSVGRALSPVLSALVAGIGDLAPPIGRLAEAFGPVLTRAIEGLTPALTKLEPGLTAIIEGLGRGVDALVDSGALDSMATAFSEIMIALAPLMPVLGQLAAVLAGALADALIAIAPGLEVLARELAETLAPILPELSESFGRLMEALAPIIPPLVEALIPALDLLPPIIELLIENFDQWAGVIEDLTPEIILVSGWIGTLIGWIVQLVAWVLRAMAAILRWAGETSQEWRDGLRDMSEDASELKDKVVTYFSTMGQRIFALVDGVRRYIDAKFHAAKAAGVAAFRGLQQGATERLSGLMTAASRIPSAVVTIFSSFGNLLYQAGRNLIIGLQNGIWSKIPDLRSTLSNVAATARAYFPFSPAKVGPLRTHPLDKAGENLSRMLAEGIERGRRIVASAAGDVAGAAVVQVDAATLSRGDEGQAAASQVAALLAELLEEIRASRGDIVLEVDSQEIARAVAGGNLQLARR